MKITFHNDYCVLHTESNTNLSLRKSLTWADKKPFPCENRSDRKLSSQNGVYVTQAARKVLSDCKLALQMLEEESDLNRWRIHWAAAVALNRAVGSVLHKVDGKNPVIRRASEERFSIWKEKSHKSHEIFREFIDKQRNNILKEYTFSYSQDDEIYVAINNKSPNQEDNYITDSSDMIPIGNNIYRPIVDGYRAGDDAHDVLSDAIEWWEKELDVIDKKISRQKND